MSALLSRINPLQRQCLVTFGVGLNSMAIGLITVFTSVILDQLKTSQEILLDATSVSWIVSITAISLFIGALMIPSIMIKLGRRLACLTTAVIIAIGWFSIYAASSLPTLLVVRFLQGFPLGFIAILGPILIAEYTTPKYRAMFMGTIPLAIFSGGLIVHTLGSMLHWKKMALIFGFIALMDVFILYFCPESPSILAMNGKYDECKKAFHWLRGPNEDQELYKMIKSQMTQKEVNRHRQDQKNNKSIVDSLKNGFDLMKRKEFLKPIIIMFHLHIVNEWSGNTIHDSFTYDIYRTVIGLDIDVAPIIVGVDIQRILSSVLALIVVRRVSRKSLLFTTVSLNITAYFVLAGYVYGKTHQLLPYDHPFIGVALINLLIFSTTMGTVPVPNIISGEIFPLQYRGVSSTITVLFFSINFFINMNIMPFLLVHIGLHGAFCVFACVVCYGATVSWAILPETKDKTLQDIEDEFRRHNHNRSEENVPMNC